MLFNSIEFAIFIPIVFLLYWIPLKNSVRGQNILLLIASYFFYGWWDWRFLSLIFLSSTLDFILGIKLDAEKNPNRRKALLITSLIANLGFLGFFKYFNFFIESFVDTFTFFGQSIDAGRLDIILPVGISFYTFQTLSYTIDVYNKKIPATRDFVGFYTFVSFFPQLVAGPIERASALLPQFFNKRIFSYQNASTGSKMILWGLFMKVVVADRLSIYVDDVYGDIGSNSGLSLAVATLFFSFQIYCDFAGYSLIAIGTAKLFDFNLMTNFKRPYFATSFKSFWSRWHISLSTWFRDYVYIPLGGSKVSKLKGASNLFITFLISGFWHGANWTFIIWGALNAIYFLPLLLTKNNRNNLDIVAQGKYFPSIKELSLMLLTFSLTVFAWIFFRSNNIGHALSFISEIISPSLLTIPKFAGMNKAFITIILVGLFVVLEWFGREGQYAIAHLGIKWNPPFRYAMYYSIIFLIMYFGNFSENQFIYFQF